MFEAYHPAVIDGIDTDVLRYNVHCCKGSKFVREDLTKVIKMVEDDYWGMVAFDVLSEGIDDLAEILSVVKAYVTNFFSYEDVMKILDEEYPYAPWPWIPEYVCL